MKLLSILLLVGTLQLTASVKAQNKLNMHLENVSVKKALDEVRKQSQFDLFYSLEEIDMKRKVNIELINTELLDGLKQILGDKYSFRKTGNIVVIRPKTDTQNTSQQQEKTIKGKVVDINGMPLPGVNVSIKGLNVGVATENDGEYLIKLPKQEKIVLVFSFIGMESKEVEVKNQKVINVTLEEIKSELDEVVVTGYQNIEKRKLSSSVITVKGDAIREGAAISVDNMLQGKIAGLSVINPTSTVGAAPKIRIRGASSISGNREPVWVVDGIILEDPVPLSPTELNSLDNVNLIGNAISSLNPEDIERIDILKDASATAIYGVKAANGVIVITTKKGKVGKPKVSYSTNFTFMERPTYDKLNRMNSKERIDVSKEAYERGLTYRLPPAHIAYEGALYDFFAKKISYPEFLGKVKSLEEQNTDWLDELFKTSMTQKHNISISGANDNTNYYFSGSYTDAKDNFKYNGLKQYNALMKLNSRITDKLRVNLKLNVSSQKKKYAHSSIDGFKYAYQTSRAIPLYNEDGSLSYYYKSQGLGIPLKYNILNELDNSERTIKLQTTNIVAGLEYDIFSSLKFNTVLSGTQSNTHQQEWFNDKTHYAANLRSINIDDKIPTTNEVFYKSRNKLPYGGQLDNNNTKLTSYTVRASLDFKKRLKDLHEINAVVGTEARSSHYEGIKTYQMGYLPDRGGKFANIDPAIYGGYKRRLNQLKDVLTDRTTNFLSFYGTFTYAFDNRYIANFNIRTDGSNKFGQDQSTKFLPVWSISGRWNVHNENFLKNTMWLNQLSVRGSYGVQGNVSDDQTPDLIAIMDSADEISGHDVSTLHKLPNPNLKWEKTVSSNIAIDATILDGRFSASLDFYLKKGQDQIVSRDVSLATGSRSMTLNAGNIENKGFDFNIIAVPIRNKDFTWELSLNGGKNINKVTNAGTAELNYEDYLSGNVVIPGKSVSTFYSYKFGGLDANGHPTFLDTEETDGISKKEMYAKMFVESGNRIADIEGGFSTNFRYKNWSLGAIFFYSFGKTLRLNPLYEKEGQYLPRPQQNMDDVFVNRWRKPGDEKFTNIPALSNDALEINSYNKIEIAENKWQMYNMSDLRTASGDFLRLRTLTLKHHLSENICKRLNISNASIRIEASNILTLKDSKLRGRDPEQISMSKDTGAIPISPTYTIGLNVTF